MNMKTKRCLLFRQWVVVFLGQKTKGIDPRRIPVAYMARLIAKEFSSVLSFDGAQLRLYLYGLWPSPWREREPANENEARCGLPFLPDGYTKGARLALMCHVAILFSFFFCCCCCCCICLFCAFWFFNLFLRGKQKGRVLVCIWWVVMMAPRRVDGAT